MNIIIKDTVLPHFTQVSVPNPNTKDIEIDGHKIVVSVNKTGLTIHVDPTSKVRISRNVSYFSQPCHTVSIDK